MLELYFIRHGQSDNNVIAIENDAEYLSQRFIDPELTPIGEEQAQVVGETLAQPFTQGVYNPHNRFGFGLTHLYCSLMIRAVSTGTAISEKTNVPLVAWPELHETGGLFDVKMVYGEPFLTGKSGPSRSYFESRFPNLILPDELTEDGWYNRDKETREHYFKRGQAIVDRILAEHGGTNHRIGFVMHAGIFAYIFTAFFQVKAENYWVSSHNCSINRIDVLPEGRVQLRYSNKVDYFPDHLITR